jgi:hypothetical protein
MSARPTRRKTPMFQARNADRYERQRLVAKIQDRSERQLICFLTGELAGIERDDALGFVDLLYNLEKEKAIDLLLHTHGGDIDAAEKLIVMVQKVAGPAELRVLVPDCAKSAGTLMALGADRVVMSDSSELGPIDPQIHLRDARGNLIPHSIQSYLDAYKQHAEALAANPQDQAARIMLGKFDPATLKMFEGVHRRARTLAEHLLVTGMFRNCPGNPTKVAGELMDTRRWGSHGQPIGAEDASVIGLHVERLAPDSQEWREIWRLYCLQRLAIADGERLFESDWVSLQMDSPA